MGYIVADALGYPYNNRPTNQMPSTIVMIRHKNKLPGFYTENSCLMLGTMKNMINFENKDLENIKDTIQTEELMGIFRDIYIGNYLMSDDDFNLRSITVKAIKNFMSGLPSDRTGIRSVESNTNEALTRMLPVGLYYAESSVDVIIEKAHQITSITHDHIRSKVASAIYCLLIRQIILKNDEKAFDLLEDYYKIKKMNNYLSELQFIKESKTKVFAGGSKVNDCFWSAWKAYSDHQNEYRSCVAHAIRYGNESNSTACIAGSLSGLTCGLNDIPQKWLDTVRLNDEVKEIIDNFIDKIAFT